jgi:hypothetical protein
VGDTSAPAFIGAVYKFDVDTATFVWVWNDDTPTANLGSGQSLWQVGPAYSG